MGRFTDCDILLTYCLYAEGIRWDKAKDIVHLSEKEIFAGGTREQNIVPADGSLELLKTLKSRDIHIAIATNDNVKDTTRDMKSIGAMEYIDIIVGADSVKSSKPDPEMVYKICKQMDIPPGRSVLVGDMLIDALMGKAAGVMLTIGVCSLLPKEVLEEYTDVVISSLNEIL